MPSPRILYFDIETFPLLSHTWNKFVDGPVVAIERDWSIASVAWKWDHMRGVRGLDCRDHVHDDTKVIEQMWRLFDEADVVIGHNGDRFDIRKVQARMLLLGLEPPSPFQSIDTLKVVKRHFNLTSNRLGDVCHALGIGDKTPTGGFELWLGCLENDWRAWDKMMRYNKQDVRLLPLLYERLRPWISNHPVLHNDGCPKCGSLAIQRRGQGRLKSGRSYVQYQCQDCKGYYRERTTIPGNSVTDVTRR